MRLMTALLILTLTLPRLPSEPPSSGPSTAPVSEALLITLTEEELAEILSQAIDEAVGPYREARKAAEARARIAEGRLARWEKAAPWAVSGALGLSLATFFAGVWIGGR